MDFHSMQLEEGSTKRRRKMMIAIAAVFVLAAAAFSLALVDLTRQEGGAEPSTNPASPFSPNSPDPELLRWNEPKAAPSVGRYKVMERTGKLTVPLSYDDVDTPFLDLTVVWRRFASAPDADVDMEGHAPKGMLLLHCGGPGSEASCGPAFATGKGQPYAIDWSDPTDPKPIGFDVWGITQRGVGDNVPAFKCANASLPTGLSEFPAKISDFTDCECALPDGTPMIGETWVDIDATNSTLAEELFTKMHLRSRRCAASPRFLLTGSNGTSFNFLEYVGTELLARDIDRFRTAVGQKLMSIVGVSYGTAVASVYASVFPDYVDRLVINGNMFPIPDTREFAQTNGATQQQAVSRLLENCATQPDCPLKDPFAAFDKIISAAQSGFLVSPLTQQGMRLNLSPGMLGGYLQAVLADRSGKGWSVAIKKLHSLAEGTPAVKEAAVASLLDQYCQFGGVKTWFNYSACIGAGQLAEGSGDTYIDQTSVLGADLAGRYDVDEAMRVYNEAANRLGTLPLGSFLGIFSAVFSWGALPTPTAPIGNSEISPLIIGNLYDPSTGYRWSQEMARAFPNSRMITWQGVGHILMPADYAPEDTRECLEHVFHYMVGKKLPLNGLTCRQHLPIPVFLPTVSK